MALIGILRILLGAYLYEDIGHNLLNSLISAIPRYGNDRLISGSSPILPIRNRISRSQHHLTNTASISEECLCARPAPIFGDCCQTKDMETRPSIWDRSMMRSHHNVRITQESSGSSKTTARSPMLDPPGNRRTTLGSAGTTQKAASLCSSLSRRAVVYGK